MVPGCCGSNARHCTPLPLSAAATLHSAPRSVMRATPSPLATNNSVIPCTSLPHVSNEDGHYAFRRRRFHGPLWSSLLSRSRFCFGALPIESQDLTKTVLWLY